jgi:nucleoside-diphosphate-sugar epimerase
MKALVIGGTGTTGPYIIDGLLKRRYHVTTLSRGVHKAELPAEVDHIYGDPHFMEALTGTLEGRSFDLVVSTYGRLRYVAEAIKGHTPRLISVGGYAIYRGWFRVTDPEALVHSEESVVPVPEEGFLEEAGADRFVDRMLESEQAVMQAHKEGYYSATHFRYCQVSGPRHLAPGEWCFIRRILDGRRQVVLPGGGQILVSRVYAENAAHAILLAVDNPDASAGQTYNIRDEVVLTNRQWVRLIAQTMGHDFEFVDLPLRIVRLGPGYVPVPLLRPDHRVMDIAKIQQQLGYHDVVSSQRGVELVTRWYMENRPERGGEVEGNLGDPFDYAAEDRLIQRSGEFWGEIMQMPESKHGFRHPYPHPKSPGDLR